jgi:hypothetical protein
MMGANWRPDPVETIETKFALLPIKTTSNKLIWFKKYVEVKVYLDSEMSHPIRSNTWVYRYTESEYMLRILRK